jgi:hypothetical protein
MYPNVATFWIDFARTLDTNGETAAAVFQLLLVVDRFLESDALAYFWQSWIELRKQESG